MIQRYNSTQANTSTPAGQVLIQNGLLTLAQLQALGGVQQLLPLAPNGQTGLDWLHALDLKLSWPKKLSERFTLEPSFTAFNALNFANFDGAANMLSGVLNGIPGSANGTTQAARNNGGAPTRIGVGSRVFSVGAPRVIEFWVEIVHVEEANGFLVFPKRSEGSLYPDKLHKNRTFERLHYFLKCYKPALKHVTSALKMILLNAKYLPKPATHRGHAGHTRPAACLSESH